MSRVFKEQFPTEVVNGVKYTRVENIKAPHSPFINKNYDFEEGFYRGEFDFVSPIDGTLENSTPETYSRHKVIAALQGYIKDKEGETAILDLGAGTLDIARTIPAPMASRINLVNSDISGPWSIGEEASTVRGIEKLRERGLLDNFASIENVEYDFNAAEWPFAEDAFDYVVTNLVLCHVAYESKLEVLKALFSTLRPGGKVLIGDVFQKDESGARFTEAGLRGPEECWGYLSVFTEFLEMCREAGFEIDGTALNNLNEGRNYQVQEELDYAKEHPHATMAINKAVWFIELHKGEG